MNRPKTAKKRFVNKRPLFCFLICFSSGIASAGKLIDSGAWVAASLAFSFTVSILFICFKKYGFAVYSTAFYAGILLLFCTSYGYYNKVVSIENADVVGRVISEKVITGDRCYFYVDKLEADGLPVKGKMRVIVPYSEDREFDFNAGDYISFTADLKPESFALDDNLFMLNYRAGIYYGDYVFNAVKLSEGSAPALVRVKLRLMDNLYGALKAETADIAYALLSGERSGISAELRGDINDSGVAHVFAVSGMHLSILAVSVVWLMKKLKLKPPVILVTVPLLLLIYGLFCGMPSSAVRSLIMTVVFLAADTFGKKKDSLSALSLSGIVVLMIFPTDLFMIGFQMSFLAVLGLIFYVEGGLKPRRRFEGIRTIIKSSLASNVMVFPVSVAAFGTLPIFFLLANVLMLPLITFIFVCLLVISIVVLVFPFLLPLLTVGELLVLPVKLIVFAIGSLGLNVIGVTISAIFSAGYYAIVLITSRFVFLSPNRKFALSAIIAALTVSSSVLNALI